MDINLIYTSLEVKNWLYDKYYCFGANYRYFTFQCALNLLNQFTENPVIIETGCQRMINDLGAGMSTLIFAEYANKYKGKLISIDNNISHINLAKEITKDYENIELIHSDSIEYLKVYKDRCDLLYLDSYDFPETDDFDEIEKAQTHQLNEFMFIEDHLQKKCILLLDDNQLKHGGKPFLLKKYLLAQQWLCLLDFQQSLWINL